ncbi:MAG: acyl-CoA thioesterase [Dehalococcoidia bacterium]|nr:acyl-CoA thioesterase [Dehalococcoidia bacterium]
MEGRDVAHSATTMSQMIWPDMAGRAGFAHGGEIMKLMDSAAGVAAVKHCHRDSVTARVEGINFYQPVRVYDLVTINSCLTFVGRSSMEVLVEVWSEKIVQEQKVRALTAHFIMVAVDDTGKPTEVPPLILSTDKERALWERGKQRYQACKGEIMAGDPNYKVCREESIS